MEDFKEGDRVVFFSSATTQSMVRKTKISAEIIKTPKPSQKRIKIKLLKSGLTRTVSRENLDPWHMYPELFE